MSPVLAETTDRAETTDPTDRADYRPVALHWGLVSLASFVLALCVFSVGRFDLVSLPAEWLEPLVPLAVMGLVSALGLIVGALGLGGTGRRAARLGIVLNGAVVGCLILVVALVVLVRTIAR